MSHNLVNFAFVGAPWTTQTEDAAAAPAISGNVPSGTRGVGVCCQWEPGRGNQRLTAIKVIVHNTENK